MKLDVDVARACERVPGLQRGALVLLPEGFLIAGIGGDSALDLEPLIRSAGKVPAPPFVEYLFVTHDQLVVIQGGRRDPRLALALVCSREHNNAVFSLSAARLAMADVEDSVDFSAWGL
jgi:hypothetical protein